MRWLTTPEKPLQGGDRRTRTLFAWKPIKVGDYTVFLERYQVREQFYAPASGAPGWWRELDKRPA